MKKAFSLFLMIFACCSLFAETQIIHRSNLIVTDKGIFCSMEGTVIPSNSITYLGDGYYAAEYYGQCGRCGSALDADGKCTNQNCEQYGPRER